MKDFVEYVVKNLVNDPSSVTVTTIDEGNCLVIKVAVNPDDMGKVIGKNGRVANSIRTVVRALSRNTNTHTVIKFDETKA